MRDLPTDCARFPPAISVVIPMRNAARYVDHAVRSVLDQRGVALEVVVVDDGSTDDSAVVVARIGDARVRVVSGPERGISAAFNVGLAHARGEFVARSDADDFYPPGRLARQALFLREHADYGAICGAFHTVTENGAPVTLVQSAVGSRDITGELADAETPTSFCTFLTRTAWLRELGGCRDFFVTAEDVDLQLRIGALGRVWYEDVNTYFYRLRQDSTVHSQADVQREFYEGCARRFHHQRTATGTDDLEAGNPPTPPSGQNALSKSVAAQIQGQLIGACWGAFSRGDRSAAYRFALRHCRLFPGAVGSWRNLLVLSWKSVLGSPSSGR